MDFYSPPGDLANLPKATGWRAIQGMGSVVATVSGYHGTERFKLIKLISQTGANYVGAMTRAITHLVCWELVGKKYRLAQNFDTKIVSHRWFEDCLKEGRRLPEDAYTMQSGKQVGPLSWEVPSIDVCGKNKCIVAGEKRTVLSDQSNTFYSAKEQEFGPKSTFCANMADAHCSLSSVCSTRHNREVSVAAEPARKSRRLVKKNASSNSFCCVVLDSEQEDCPTENFGQLENINSASTDLDKLINGVALSSRGQTLVARSTNVNRNRDERFEILEDIEELNKFPTLMNANNSMGDSACSPNETTSEKDDNNKNGVYNADNLSEPTGLLIRNELSCVICWTDFSATRGVLPCGHRFCYACIQEWAACMVAKRKAATCPLCKASFVSITRVEGGASSDQKIYSQTLPPSCSETDIFVLPDSDHNFEAQPSESVCFQCWNHEPVDLLLSCCVCQSQWVHSCCLDPPLVPWTCIHCRDLRMLYQRLR